MNVVLIGYRCSGKTCVGKELAQRLGRVFIDCDEYIEQKTNLTIREIFDIAGEAYFRMLESDAIAELAKLEGRVVATGGGAVLKYKNIRNLKRNGVVVYLDASVGIVAATGLPGARLMNRRPYLNLGISYPDLTVFADDDDGVIVRAAGFFGNDWSVERGEFVWGDEDGRVR